MLGIQELYQATETDRIYKNYKGNTNEINILKKFFEPLKNRINSRVTQMFLKGNQTNELFIRYG